MISVIVPNYNHSEYLNQRIDSILNQTYQNFEIILLDDASTDNSKQILESYKNHSKVSHVFINDTNSGSPFGMWEKGFSLASGEIIWIAESDDWSDYRFLETLIVKHENEDVVVSHCLSYNYYMNTGITKINSWWTSFRTTLWDSDYFDNGRVVLQKYGQYKCPVINVSSALIKKSILKNVQIPIGYKYCGDWWFWAQVFNNGSVAYSSKALNYIRVHDSSATSYKQTNSILRMDEIVKVMADISQLLDEKVKYNKNYEWLTLYWVKEIFNNKNYFKSKFIFPNLPLSFFVVFYSTLSKELFKKIMQKLSL